MKSKQKNQRQERENLQKALMNEYFEGYDKFSVKERRIILNCFYLTDLSIDDILKERNSRWKGQKDI